MSLPDYQTLMRPLLACLQDGEAKSLTVLIAELSAEFNLTEAERNERIPSGGSTYIYNRVAWARTYLKQAGLLTIPYRGSTLISDAGLKALADCPQRIDNRYLKQFESFQDFQRIKPKSTDTSIESNGDESEVIDDSLADPQERLEQAHLQIQNSLAADLLQLIKEQTPQFFERLVVELMQSMGYGGWSKDSGQATQYTADGGIDGIINEDPLGLETIYLQAKRYSDNAIGRPDIQAFVGALEMNRARKGVFITTSRFSRDAVEYVSMIEKKVVLIDGKQLAILMIEHDLGVFTKASYQIKAIDSDYFSED